MTTVRRHILRFAHVHIELRRHRAESRALEIAEAAAREMHRLGLLSGPTRALVDADLAQGWPRPAGSVSQGFFGWEEARPPLHMVNLLLAPRDYTWEPPLPEIDTMRTSGPLTSYSILPGSVNPKTSPPTGSRKAKR